MHVLITFDLRHAEHERLLRERELARRGSAPAGHPRPHTDQHHRYAVPLSWARRRRG